MGDLLDTGGPRSSLSTPWIVRLSLPWVSMEFSIQLSDIAEIKINENSTYPFMTPLSFSVRKASTMCQARCGLDPYVCELSWP
jgi:hypothetical protein